jgi:hypothetical protein
VAAAEGDMMFNQIHRHIATTRRVLHDPIDGNTDIAGIRAATGAAQNAALTAAQTGAGYGAQAGGIGGMLVPYLESSITNPQGFGPAATNAMLVEGLEGAGGAASGIAGEAGLRAARSRNVGGATGVLDEAAREKMRTSAGVGLDVATKNAMLQQQQRSQAQQQLEGLYGTDVGAQLKAQSLVPEDINAWTNASKTGWLQNVEGVMGAVGGMAGASRGGGLKGLWSG